MAFRFLACVLSGKGEQEEGAVGGRGLDLIRAKCLREM